MLKAFSPSPFTVPPPLAPLCVEDKGVDRLPLEREWEALLLLLLFPIFPPPPMAAFMMAIFFMRKYTMPPSATLTPHPSDRYTLSATAEPMREEACAAPAAIAPPPRYPLVLEGVGVGVTCLAAPPLLDVGVGVGVVEGEAPRERLWVGLEVGEPDSVGVLVVDGDRPTLIEEVGVMVGLPLNVGLDEVEGLAPGDKLLVGVCDGLEVREEVEVVEGL